MPIQTRELSPNFGAEVIGVDLTREVDEATKQEILAAWIEYGVLLFRGAPGSDEVHMRLSSIFGQMEPAFGLVPGGGAVQHLTRLMGRARALEVLLGAEDYDATIAEQYGWINRALPADALNDFVRSLAHRIAGFPAAGQVAVKDRVNAIALAPIEDFRRDSDLFGESVRHPEAQGRIQTAMRRGFQTRDAELDLTRMLGELADP